MPVTPQGRQLSLFGVEATASAPSDLEGLLAGPGQVTRMGGTARVSVVVSERWRVMALLEEFRSRGLAAGCEPATAEGHFGVRTAYASALAPLGVRWLRGALKAVPKGFTLDGQRLRLWAAAAGTVENARAYGLRLGSGDGEAAWKIVGKALAAAGLPAVLLGQGAGGPAYRIAGRRRISRLVELVGEAPGGAPADSWPQ
ncbi:MAG: hypothetical protein HKP61_19215 [Dactylosporangium sp.]|nr:hypothetical protein [Dactylosporangium sp.]NNJ63020.1 hypothetical protein [Dactylosporangium sp.]